MTRCPPCAGFFDTLISFHRFFLRKFPPVAWSKPLFTFCRKLKEALSSSLPRKLFDALWTWRGAQLIYLFSTFVSFLSGIWLFPERVILLDLLQ